MIFTVTDNFLSRPALAQLEQEYAAAYANGLHEEGASHDNFVRFPHYDAYRFIPNIDSTGLRSYWYELFNQARIAELRQLCGKGEMNDFALEFHYHKPNGLKGYPHTDNEIVSIKEDPQLEGALAGANFYKGRNDYRVKGAEVEGCRRVKRSIVCLLYLNTDPEAGETVLFTKLPDGSFTETFKVAPVRNRLLTLSITPDSWHASAATARERKLIACFFHERC